MTAARPSSTRLAIVMLVLSGVALGLLMAWLAAGWDGDGQAAIGSAELTPIPERAAVGDPAPDFEASTPTGKAIRLSSLRGVPVALNFWATWCAPCRVEMPDLEAAAKRYADTGLVVLGVNAGEDGAQIQDYYRDVGLTFDSVLDPNLKIVDLYDIRAFPTTVWIDRKGIVRAKHLGALTAGSIDQYVSDVSAKP